MRNRASTQPRSVHQAEPASGSRRTPPRHILNAHPSDQRSQTRIDLRPPSHGACFPAPIAAKTGTMPAHNSLRSDDRNGLEDRGKPTIQLDEEQAIAVREVDATAHLALQHDQLMSERRISRAVVPQ